MRVGPDASQFRLDTGHSVEKLFRRRRASFDFSERLMEDFGDIKQTDNVSFLVADGLKRLVLVPEISEPTKTCCLLDA